MSDQHTPLMKQYYDIKGEYPDALMLFQVGDFYEFFYQDAVIAAQCLGITLTERGKSKGEPIPLCGVPVHACDMYVAKLVKAGHKVVICDQLEVAQPGTVVRRGVTQVLTPGTLTDNKLLDGKSASYLLVCFPAQAEWGILCAELLTAQLFATCITRLEGDKELEAELVRFFPDEILLPDTPEGRGQQAYFKKLGYFTTVVSMHDFHSASIWAEQQLHNQGTDRPKTYNETITQALSYFYAYLEKNQRHALSLFTTIHFYKHDDFLIIDATTQRNLDLVRNSNDSSAMHTLFSILDAAATGMGSRMIKKWITRPLAQKTAIEQRLDIVSFFVQNIQSARELYALLKIIGDIERIIGRICLLRASLHDYRMLSHALDLLPDVATLFEKPLCVPYHATFIREQCIKFDLLAQLLRDALDQEGSDRVIKEGYDQELDRLRLTISDVQQRIMTVEKQEQEKTGINSLKVRYNGIHGYCIEITKTHAHAIPSSYVRLQTLIGKERFITPELQALYHEISHAQEIIGNYEKTIFEHIKKEVLAQSSGLRRLAYALAHCDALISFALCADRNHYVRPILTDDRSIRITQGRHPVVEQSMNTAFIPNDTMLDDEQSLWIITGPNMGGKSTYLRQVALQCIMAHCGSFVPAKRAEISLLDRIFSRIGAGDNLAQGKSTFLVEMEETAAICKHATSRSLVILDEVGRGTSTYDGLSVAWAVIEYVYHTVKARCLFATHYHELTDLTAHYSGIAQYHAVCKKTASGILFLYRIMPGIAHGSFGIDVARLARVPDPIIVRAQEILAQLHTVHNHIPQNNQKQAAIVVTKEKCVPAVHEELALLDLDTLSGRDALNLLYQWR
jgi:DNA mismatch repair protein MutS